MNGAIRASGSLPEGLRKVLGVNSGEFRSFLEDVVNEPKKAVGKPGCTADNPGFAIDTFFLDKIGELPGQYRELAEWIKARGERDGKVPRIVFTTYHDPFPEDADRDSFVSCPDLGNLQPGQMSYLSELLTKLEQAIAAGVGGIEGVQIVDIRQVLDGHRWCSDEPWAYGMTTLLGDIHSQAPFHPTPKGQLAIAELVWKTVGPLAAPASPAASPS